MTLLAGRRINESPLLHRNYKTMDKKIICFIIALSACILFFSCFGFAENAISKVVDDMSKQIYNNDYHDIAKFLKFGTNTLDTSGFSLEVWKVVVAVYGAIEALGYSLITLYCLLDIMEKAQADNLTPELIMRALIKLFIAFFLIKNGLKIIVKLIEIGNALIGAVGTAGAGASSPYTHVEYGLFAAIGQLVKVVVPWLLALLAKLVVYLISLSRLVQIGVYAVFAPVGMANIYEGGMNSSGFRYLKKFMAVILQGAIIVAILVVVGKLQQTVINQFGLGELLAGAAIGLMQLMLIVRSQTWANDVLGV